MTFKTISELAEAQRRFSSERDWDQFHSARNLAAALAVEAGELQEHFLWLSDAESDSLEPLKKDAVSLELADVLIHLVRLADRLGIDLLATAERKMRLNAEKYPVEKSRGSNRKY